MQRRLRCGECSPHPSGVDKRDRSRHLLSDLSVFLVSEIKEPFPNP